MGRVAHIRRVSAGALWAFVKDALGRVMGRGANMESCLCVIYFSQRAFREARAISQGALRRYERLTNRAYAICSPWQMFLRLMRADNILAEFAFPSLSSRLARAVSSASRFLSGLSASLSTSVRCRREGAPSVLLAISDAGDFECLHLGILYWRSVPFSRR